MYYDPSLGVITYESPERVKTQIRPMGPVMHVAATQGCGVDHQRGFDYAEAKTCTYYVNKSAMPVMVQDRHGVILKIFPNKDKVQDHTLTIIKRFLLTGRSLIEFRSTIQHFNNGLRTPELEILNEAVKVIGSRHLMTHFEVVFEWKVDVARIAQRPWLHYQTDLMLYSEGHTDVVHPSCAHYHRNFQPSNLGQDYRSMAEVKVVYVDPDPNARSLWLVLAGQVMEIAPQSGWPCLYEKTKTGDQPKALIYVFHTLQSDSGDQTSLCREIYTLDEAREKLGLFDNQYDAANLGDARTRQSIEAETLKMESLARQRELAEAQAKLEDAKRAAEAAAREAKERNEQLARKLEEERLKAAAETDRLKRIQEEKDREYEARRKEAERHFQEQEFFWKRQTEHEKRETERLRAELERKSSERKDNSDWMKFIFGTVTAVVGIIAFFVKLFTPAAK